MALPQNWAQSILRGIGAPVTPQNLRFLAAWQRAEGGGTANRANFNPLNTTQQAPGAGSINSVGVRSYRNPQQGIRATVATLLNGHYGDIVQGLRHNEGANALAHSAGLSTWGTGSGVLRVLGAGGSLSPAKGISGGTTPGPGPNLAGPQAANGAATSAFKQLEVANLLQQSTDEAQGRAPDPNSLLNLALARQTFGSASPQAQNVAQGKPAMPLVTGNPTQKEQHAVQTASKYIHTWYKWGGSNPKTGFDCSGLLQYAWGQSGVKIPRTTYDQYQSGTPVASQSQLHPGDAVFFRGSDPRGNLPGHVGMYIGHGQFIEAPHTGAQVQISNLAGRTDYVGARRYA